MKLDYLACIFCLFFIWIGIRITQLESQLSTYIELNSMVRPCPCDGKQCPCDSLSQPKIQLVEPVIVGDVEI
jgi:hypothetical protein